MYPDSSDLIGPAKVAIIVKIIASSCLACDLCPSTYAVNMGLQIDICVILMSTMLESYNKKFSVVMVTQLSPRYASPLKVTGMPFFVTTFLPYTSSLKIWILVKWLTGHESTFWTSQKFSGVINPFVSSVRPCFKLSNLAFILPFLIVYPKLIKKAAFHGKRIIALRIAFWLDKLRGLWRNGPQDEVNFHHGVLIRTLQSHRWEVIFYGE